MSREKEQSQRDRNVLADSPDQEESPPLALVRTSLGGVLMGLANLVPGVSGGTMIVIMGLYDEFVTSIADVTRFRFTRRNVQFLVIIVALGAVSIVTLAGTLGEAVRLHRSLMFSLFVGMTLGGVPLLLKMLKRITPAAAIGGAIGVAAMVTLAMTAPVAPSELDPVAVVAPSYARDFAAGLLGMSAMVLPGVSGAYMLLILGRYEVILSSIDLCKDYVVSAGEEGDPLVFLRVLIPVALGAILSLVGLSNLLKWMLRRHQSLTLGILLGILLGSVIGIWPFSTESTPGDYGVGLVLAVGGFVGTVLLSRIST